MSTNNALFFSFKPMPIASIELYSITNVIIKRWWRHFLHIASLTVRILPSPSETEEFPRLLFLHVPGSKNGDGTFNVQECIEVIRNMTNYLNLPDKWGFCPRNEQ
jgi:hypothetical protein